MHVVYLVDVSIIIYTSIYIYKYPGWTQGSEETGRNTGGGGKNNPWIPW